MLDPILYPRYAQPHLEEALDDTPVVLVHGPRQSGKTTLARLVGEPRGFTCLTFDDDVLAAGATADPLGFLSNLPEQVILDEVQRVPGLFTGLKALVDRRRRPGQFILTGSANVLLVPTLADSLAGRMEILRLHPLAQCEIEATPPTFLARLFAGDFLVRPSERLGHELAERIVAGGYPAALARATPRRRSAWYRDYVETLVQRDVRNLAQISKPDVLPRLLQVAASQTARMINVAELAAPFPLARPTIATYVTLLERVFLIDSLPPWHSDRLSRLVKTPKLHIGDSGLAAALLGLDAESIVKERTLWGQVVETFAYQELRRQASWAEAPYTFYHFRDRDGAEVDMVIERSAHALAGVEVKASATVTAGDFRGLHKLRAAAGERFVAGIVLYDGETSVPFGDRLWAVPFRELWRGPTG